MDGLMEDGLDMQYKSGNTNQVILRHGKAVSDAEIERCWPLLSLSLQV